MKSKEKRAAEIQDSIREILLRDWDPIGIKDEPRAQDEYDLYIGRIYRLLSSNSSEDQVVDCLYRIETERMGFDSRRSGLYPVARKLLTLDVRL
jgi:hypothetical protein